MRSAFGVRTRCARAARVRHAGAADARPALQVAKHMTHPLACIDAVEAGVIRGGPAGIKKEGELFKARRLHAI